MSKLDHQQDVRHHRVLLSCRLVVVCDLEATVWWPRYIASEPSTIHHHKSHVTIKSGHCSERSERSAAATALRCSSDRRAKMRWRRWTSTSCCAFNGVRSQCCCMSLWRPECWTRRKTHRQTSEPDPERPAARLLKPENPEFMTFRVQLATQRGLQQSVRY